MTVPWDCYPEAAYITGGIWFGVAGLVIGWLLGRWNRNGGRIEIYRTYDYSQEGDE